MTCRSLFLLACLIFGSGGARAGEISLSSYFEWHPRNYTVHLDSWSTDEMHESKATGTGNANSAECGLIATDQRLYVWGGAWGEAMLPAGRASAERFCAIDFQLTVLEERPGPEPLGSGFASGYEAWTNLHLDTATDVARYGWAVGIVLDSLDRDLQRSFAASADTPGCEPYYPGDVRPYPCINWDMHSAILSGFQVGERVSGRMFVNAFVDLRTVPEPSILGLLAMALLALRFGAARGRRLRGR